jgi:uncharacterized membrane protein
MKKIILASIPLSVMPIVAFAQVTNIEELIDLFSDILGWLMPLLVSLAVIYFIWGVLTYVMNAGDEEKQKEGRSMMIYGIIAIFVMVSVWGFVGILSKTFFGGAAGGGSVPRLPELP